MTATKINFYYDPVSPWTYFASVLLKRYSKLWNLQVELFPVFLGGVMQGAKNNPPISVANKGKYMVQNDLPKTSQYIGVPANIPPNFPPLSLYALRFLRVVKDLEDAETLERVSNRFYEAFFVHSLPTAFEPSTFPSTLLSLSDGPFVNQPPSMTKEQFEKCNETLEKRGEEYKKVVKEEAGELVKKGCFGFPWIEITHPESGEIGNFFGSDRFELIAWWLGKEWKGPFPDGTPTARPRPITIAQTKL